MEGNDGRAFYGDHRARRAAALECFARYYGERAREPRRYVDIVWPAEQWTRGAYGSFNPPGVITAIAGVEEALALPGVDDVLVRMGVGEEIPSYRTCVDRPCFVITSGDTRAEALAAFARAEETISIRTGAVPATA